MSAVQAAPPSPDALVVRLDEMLAELADAVADNHPASDADRIDRIARLEKLRAATAALQAAESVRFAQSQVAEQLGANVHPDAIGRGIAEQIGLACHISPATAARRLNTARALWFELPDTYGQLTSGMLSERVAEAVVAETRHMEPDLRRGVDTRLQAAGIAPMGFKTATPPVSARRPMRPIARAICSVAAPNANTAGSGSGQPPTQWPSSPATCQSNKASPAMQRYGDPTGLAPPVKGRSGPIVGGDPTRRYFDGWLATLIKLRDQTCRDPFCDAPIRHIDHITRHVNGGSTTFTNGRGACARGNQAREMPGWCIKLIDGGPHTLHITTPTGHHYFSRAPDPP